MEAIAIDPDTGKKLTVDLEGINQGFFDQMSDFSFSESDIKHIVDNLNISADAKMIVHKLAKVTIRVGQTIIKIGRKILDFVVKFFETYPHATFGLILGFIVGFLIAHIPIIGIALGAILKPLLAAFGLLRGYAEDLKDNQLRRKIESELHMFDPLKSK